MIVLDFNAGARSTYLNFGCYIFQCSGHDTNDPKCSVLSSDMYENILDTPLKGMPC